MILLHPHRLERHYPDERSREVMEKTVAFFEAKGKRRLKEDDVANGSKYYIGNGNQAALVSTFGTIPETVEYCFFAVDTSRAGYECVQNVVHSQNFVSEYRLADYPVAESDITQRGDEAWNAALNTVNIGKFNLGWASIGICTHAFYEAIHHAAHRHLYGMAVTDEPRRPAPAT